MNYDVTHLEPGFAMVVGTPSLWRRWLLRHDLIFRFATKVGREWTWSDSCQWIREPRVERLLNAQ